MTSRHLKMVCHLDGLKIDFYIWGIGNADCAGIDWNSLCSLVAMYFYGARPWQAKFIDNLPGNFDVRLAGVDHR